MVVPTLFIASLLDSRMLVPLESKSVRTGAYSYALPKRRDARRAATFTEWLKQAALGGAAAGNRDRGARHPAPAGP